MMSGTNNKTKTKTKTKTKKKKAFGTNLIENSDEKN